LEEIMSVTTTTKLNAWDFIGDITNKTTPQTFEAHCSRLSDSQIEKGNVYTLAMIKAAMIGNGVLIEHIVRNKGQNINSTSMNGYNPPIVGAIYGPILQQHDEQAVHEQYVEQQYAVVKQIVELGADLSSPCVGPETATDFARTPAELAIRISVILTPTSIVCERISKRVVKLLLCHQATIRFDKLDQEETACLSDVIEKSEPEVELARNTMDYLMQLPLPQSLVFIVGRYAVEQELEPAFMLVQRQITHPVDDQEEV
jgi:hypothetical protein